MFSKQTEPGFMHWPVNLVLQQLLRLWTNKNSVCMLENPSIKIYLFLAGFPSLISTLPFSTSLSLIKEKANKNNMKCTLYKYSHKNTP